MSFSKSGIQSSLHSEARIWTALAMAATGVASVTMTAPNAMTDFQDAYVKKVRLVGSRFHHLLFQPVNCSIDALGLRASVVFWAEPARGSASFLDPKLHSESRDEQLYGQLVGFQQVCNGRRFGESGAFCLDRA
jgi:hypothetical protein